MNTAVIDCGPADANEVVALAEPPESATAAPTFVDPSLNWTLPTAVDGETVAVRATLAPVTAVVGLAESDVVVATAGAVTVTVAAELVEAVNAVGSVGVNTAVIDCGPADANDVVALAVPPETVSIEPMFVEPSLNWTEPTASDGVTVAASETLPPVTAAVGVAVTAVVVVTADGGGVVTDTVTALLVEAVKDVGAVGVNTPVIECEPAAANDVVMLAVPPETVTAVPMFAEPSLN